MKKIYLFFVIIFYSGMAQLHGIEKENVFIIYTAIEKLGDKFGKIYSSDKKEEMQKLNPYLSNLKEATKSFESLKSTVNKIEAAIESNNSDDFWLAEEELRAFLRRNLTEPYRPQKSYLESFMSSITDKINKFYWWVFSSKSTNDL